MSETLVGFVGIVWCSCRVFIETINCNFAKRLVFIGSKLMKILTDVQNIYLNITKLSSSDSNFFKINLLTLHSIISLQIPATTASVFLKCCSGGFRISQKGTQAPKEGYLVVDFYSKILDAPRSNFLHFTAIFGKIWSNNRLSTQASLGLATHVWEILDPWVASTYDFGNRFPKTA